MPNIFARQKASVALWSSLAAEFQAEEYMELAKTEPVVLLFCGLTPGYYRGNNIYMADAVLHRQCGSTDIIAPCLP